MTRLARALAVGTRLLLLDERLEGVAPTLSKWQAEVLMKLEFSELSTLIARSDLNHSRRIVEAEDAIERGANAGC